MNHAQKRVIFVLGMHRSGTSLTTGILNALGVSLGDELIPPDENNRLGYFESPTVGRIHDHLLRALGSAWYASTTVKPLPNQWWRLPAVQPFKQQLRDLVLHQLGVSGGVWAFKDPRTCRLLPLWHDIIAEIGASSSYMLVVRSPQEVARSLQARDGLSPLRSEMLWLEHTAEAILCAPASLETVVDYDRWFTDAREQAARMIAGLQLAPPDHNVLDTAIARLVAGDLRHHRIENTAFHLLLTRDLYDALLARDSERAQLLAHIFNLSRAFSAVAMKLAQEPAPAAVTAGD